MRGWAVRVMAVGCFSSAVFFIPLSPHFSSFQVYVEKIRNFALKFSTPNGVSIVD